MFALSWAGGSDHYTAVFCRSQSPEPCFLPFSSRIPEATGITKAGAFSLPCNPTAQESLFKYSTTSGIGIIYLEGFGLRHGLSKVPPPSLPPLEQAAGTSSFSVCSWSCSSVKPQPGHSTKLPLPCHTPQLPSPESGLLLPGCAGPGRDESRVCKRLGYAVC